MSLEVILPQKASQILSCFHQKLSWKIKEEKWMLDGSLILQLDAKIPGSSPCSQSYLGGCVVISRQKGFIRFHTSWPIDVDLKNIRLDAEITIKISDGSSVRIKCDERQDVDYELEDFQGLRIEKGVELDADLLYDEERCFVLEAELKVTHVDTNDEVSKKSKVFVNDMGSIFHDSETSDVVIISGEEKFYCHKNILSARCEVFKNMLAPHINESENNTIEIKEVASEAVKSMLKYIYSGEVPEDPKKLTPDLLNIAEMYFLDHLKEACVESLQGKLEVSSCISIFIIADRFNSSGNLKDVVMEFIKCKAEEVLKTDDFVKLMKADPALTQELLKIVVKGCREKHRCKFCVVSYVE